MGNRHQIPSGVLDLPEFKIINDVITRLDFNVGRVQNCLAFSQKGDDSNKTDPESLEDRFSSIKLSIPELKYTENAEKNQQEDNKLLEWLGILSKRIFSYAFKKFIDGKFNIKQTKIFCSENIILNIINFCQKNHLSPEKMKYINSKLRKDLLPYFLTKYPQSEEAEVNVSLNGKVRKIDNVDSNFIDLISKSGVKFQYSEQENYNKPIMQFLNYILKLPQMQDNYEIYANGNDEQYDERNVEFKRNTFYKQFEQDMQYLFKKLQDEQKVEKMKIIDLANIRDRRPDPLVENIAQQYRDRLRKNYIENVQSYTKYLIGRKLSKNMANFSLNQINDGNFTLSNSSLMRVITKWSGQLRSYFASPHEFSFKEGQFRMKDGTERYLTYYESEFLEFLLSQKQKIINDQLSKIRRNNYQHQSTFGQKQFRNMLIYSEEESEVGMFSTVMKKNYENYLIEYLNLLIHNLLSVMAEFQNFLYYREHMEEDLVQATKYRDFSGLLKKINKFAKNKDKNQSEYFDNLVPNLLTFKVADLMRCRIQSKQLEINALYNEIQRISSWHPDFLKIIRIKNRLQKGTKDILINLMYRNSLIVQIQLAINSNKSKFIDCSDQFNHYIYELERAEFGPLSQMCGIWIKNDPRANFFIEKFDQNNKRKKRSANLFRIKDLEAYEEIKFPFKCDFCDFYYTDTLFVGKHRFYYDEIGVKKKGCKMCFLCVLENQRTYKNIRDEILPQLPEPSNDKHAEEQICDLKEIPEFGVLMRLKSKERNIKYFKKIRKGKKIYLFEKLKNGYFNAIAQISSEREERIFLSENLIVRFDDLSKRIYEIDEMKVNREYFIPQMLKETDEARKISLKLVRQNLDDNCFNLGMQITEVKKINFSENKIRNIEPIAQMFPKAQTFILNQNEIDNVKGIQTLQGLRKLGLEKNKLQEFEQNITQLTQLQILSMSKNCIKHISSKISNLKKLVQLDLHLNKIKKLPNSITSLPLKKLQLSNNQIQNLPERIGELQQLEYFNIAYNKLEHLPETFTKLNIKTALIEHNQLKDLPDSFGDLKNLDILDISDNPLRKLPSSFGDLFISQLVATNNKFQLLPPSICKLRKLQKIYIDKNKLASLPENFKKLKIEELDLTQNQFYEFPKAICDIEQLKALIINKNHFHCLPDQFSKLNISSLSLGENDISKLDASITKVKTLKEVYLEKNRLHNIDSFPEDFQKLHIQTLNLDENNLKKIPHLLCNITTLKTLSLGRNQIQELPQKFGNLYIQTLNLSHNQLRKLPESFSKLDDLYELNLSFNNLIDLPDISKLQIEVLHLNKNNFNQLPSCLANMKMLIVLEMEQNNISLLPEDFGSNNPQLQSLSLQNNYLKTLPKNFGNLKKLRQLNLSANSIETLPESFGKLKIEFLDMKDNEIKTLPLSVCQLTKLKNLSLEGNELSTLPEQFENLKSLDFLSLNDNQLQILPNCISSLVSLKQLFLSFNQMKKLPHSFGRLNIEYLDISYNSLTQFPETFVYLSVLYRLEASYNKISYIPEYFTTLNIEVLNLKGNKIAKIPAKLHEMANLQQLYLDDNPLEKIPQQIKKLELKKLSASTQKLDLKSRDVYKSIKNEDPSS